MPNEIKLEITITKEAVEAAFNLLSTLFPLREESTKEEITPITPLTSNTTITTTTSTTIDNNNINNNSDVVDDDVDANNNLSNSDEEYPPTLGDISEYITTKGYKMDANRFYRYYKGLGWKTKGGTSIIGCWKDYIDSWMNNGIRNNVSIKGERREARPFVPTEF